MGVSLQRYRPYEGDLGGSWSSPLPIARVALRMMFRRKLFWALYVVALLNFMVFFSGIYLFTQVETLVADGSVQPAQARVLVFQIRDVHRFLDRLRSRLYLAGTAETYQNFFWFQGYIVMAVVALAGSVVVGNDYQHGSLGFYLSKPLGRRHYLIGKLLAVALFINMMTTLPALLLFAECGLLMGWDYFPNNARLFWGILGYGAILSACLSVLVVATASWVRKTMPMVLVWVGLLLFCRFFAELLVSHLRYHHSWRLIDLWNSMYILGSEALGVDPRLGRFQRGMQPELWQAALVLSVVCATCLIYLSRRIRAVEIVK